MNRLERALVWIAGADPEILSRPGCEQAVRKYVAFGILACFPALLATAAAYITASFGMPPMPAAIVAVFAGAFVLNVERVVLMQLSTKRAGVKNRAGWALVVRLGLATVVGVATTTGVSLAFFKTAIDRELASRNLVEMVSARAPVDSLLGAEFRSVQSEQRRIHAEVASRKEAADDAFRIQEAEGAGQRSTLGAGAGALWRADSARYADLKVEVTTLERRANSELASLRVRERSLIARRDSLFHTVRDAQGAGPADRLRALYVLERRDPAIAFISLAFFLVLFSVDLTPALLKLTARDRDSYESFTDRVREDQVALHDSEAAIAVHAARLETERRTEQLDHLSKVAQATFASAATTALMKDEALTVSAVVELVNATVLGDTTALGARHQPVQRNPLDSDDEVVFTTERRNGSRSTPPFTQSSHSQGV